MGRFARALTIVGEATLSALAVVGWVYLAVDIEVSRGWEVWQGMLLAFSLPLFALFLVVYAVVKE